jgi:hypothetical protein
MCTINKIHESTNISTGAISKHPIYQSYKNRSKTGRRRPVQLDGKIEAVISEHHHKDSLRDLAEEQERDKQDSQRKSRHS